MGARRETKKWEAPAEVWAKWQAVTAGAFLINGGLFSLFYSWPIIDVVGTMLPILYKPVSIPGVLSIFFGIFIICLECLSSMNGLNQSFKFWPKAFLYLVMAAIAFLQFTTIVPAQFMVITAVTNMVAAFQEEPAPLPTMK